MTGQTKIRQNFMITVYPDDGGANAIRVEFVPRGPQAVREPGRPTRQVPRYVVRAFVEDRTISTRWEEPPPPGYKLDPGFFEAEAVGRLKKRIRWLDLLGGLIDTVEGWSRELGWATKRVRKELKDSEIGGYVTRALLLQKETARVLLEPVGHGSPDAEGVVDLYRLPAYDDIASLYYYNERWNIHSMAAGTPAVGNIREAASQPLSLESLRNVLEEMKADVA